MRVLLADTDEVHLEIVQSFLWDRGHEAEIAADGLECISILREFAPDVLVLDRDLLWGGSEGVLATLQREPLLPEIPVILTAEAGFDDSWIGLSPLPVARLAKPYRLGDLLGHIEATRRRDSTSKRISESVEMS